MKIAKDLIKKSIKLQYGNLKAVSRQLNCCRKSLYNWINKDKELQECLYEARETFKDYVESILFNCLECIDPKKPTYQQVRLLIFYHKFYRGSKWNL